MGWLTAVTPTLTRVALGYVNAYLVGHPPCWVLVDTGERGHASALLKAAAQFAGDVPPRAIVLTHGHFDHAGGARELAQRWGVPIYASRFELPFLRAAAAYPQPDPAVCGFYGWLAQFVAMPGRRFGRPMGGCFSSRRRRAPDWPCCSSDGFHVHR